MNVTVSVFSVKSKAFEFGNVLAPHPKSGGPGSRERTKSFRLTNMVVDEDSTDVRFKVKVTAHSVSTGQLLV